MKIRLFKDGGNIRWCLKASDFSKLDVVGRMLTF
jgi:hypothetical protein